MRFEYDEEEKGKNPFWIDTLTPIQLATFDLDEYQRLRGRVHDRRVARPADPEHGLRAVGDGSAAQAAVPRPADPAVRAELQPDRARAAGDGQELRGAGALAVHGAAHRADDGREPLRPHERPREGDGDDLGRRRVRRGRRSPEDAARGHHDAEDLLRVGPVPARPRGCRRLRRASRCSATPTSPWT